VSLCGIGSFDPGSKGCWSAGTIESLVALGQVREQGLIEIQHGARADVLASGSGGTIMGAGGAGGTSLGGSSASSGDAGGGGGAGDTGGSLSAGVGGDSGTGGASGSPDGGRDLIASDAGSPDVRRNSIPPDASSPDGTRDERPSDTGSTGRLGHKGCDCALGHTARGTPRLPFALLGAAFLWRRLRRRS
jgi:hypothetical protein